jgi:hypothetical protein
MSGTSLRCEPTVRCEPAVHGAAGGAGWRPATAPRSSSRPWPACAERSSLRSRSPEHRRPSPHAAARRVVRARRRFLLALLAGGIVVALALPWGGVGRPPLATSGPVPAGATVTPHSLYVVHPGDTLWGIAERLSPGGDPRPVVAELEAQLGSDAVQPGQRLRLP